MFKKKWPRRIISDTGFEVQIKSRGSILYREGDRSLELNSEYLADNLGIAIYKKFIRTWDPPFNNEKITE